MKCPSCKSRGTVYNKRSGVTNDDRHKVIESLWCNSCFSYFVKENGEWVKKK